jgi:hypothetical protein
LDRESKNFIMGQCAWNWFEDAVLEKTLLDTPGAAYFQELHVSGHDRLYKWLIFLTTPGRALLSSLW